jgi:hypothetical protein
MTVPKPIEPRLTKRAPEKVPALPAKRARRRSTRGSHSWRFRRPPSRKRVEVATARRLPEGMPTPPQAPDLYPINDNRN